MIRPLSDRPSVTLKLATSLDGRIATKTGASQWITGPQARAKVHQMRGQHDCVLTGIGTVLADDPLLTARSIPLPPQQPLRAVLDSKARTPTSSKLLTSQDVGEVCLFHAADAVKQTDKHVKRFIVPRKKPKNGLDLQAVLSVLQDEYGVASIMVEAGSKVATAFLNEGLVDRLVWFRAPILIGGDGLPAIGPLGISDLTHVLAFQLESLTQCGQDVMETYVKKSPQSER
jgi:diaminohydroxyphosphoribosylaminopyrimidine deaminase / 5-amino-6-(5-phosphoribosylamino)uracil reductase